MYTKTPRGPGGEWTKRPGPDGCGVGWDHAAAGAAGVIVAVCGTKAIEWAGAHAIAGCLKGSRWVKTKWKETKWADRD